MSVSGKNPDKQDPRVVISVWANEILDHWSQGKAKAGGKKGLLNDMIFIFNQLNVHPSELKEKLEELKKSIDARAILVSGDCPALAIVKGNYVCIWGRLNKTPQTKIIAIVGDEESVKSCCKSCNKTRQVLQGIADYEKEIAGLKASVIRGSIVNVPSCVRGGRLSDDGKKLYCQRSGQFSKVERCKTLQNGANCKELRWTRIEMKGKLPEEKK